MFLCSPGWPWIHEPSACTSRHAGVCLPVSATVTFGSNEAVWNSVDTGQGLVGPGSQLELQAGTTVVSRKHSQQKADLSLRLVVTPQAFPVRPWRPVGIIRLRTLALLGVPHWPAVLAALPNLLLARQSQNAQLSLTGSPDWPSEPRELGAERGLCTERELEGLCPCQPELFPPRGTGLGQQSP